jgi:hypothetical protein
MKNQTAVEYIKEKLICDEYWYENMTFEQIFEQAKEMEKQQIMDAAYFGHLKGWVDCGVENSFGEEYYKETFKSEEDETDGQND